MQSTILTHGMDVSWKTFPPILTPQMLMKLQNLQNRPTFPEFEKVYLPVLEDNASPLEGNWCSLTVC